MRLSIVDMGRRRRFSLEEKLRIMEESFGQPRIVTRLEVVQSGARRRWTLEEKLRIIEESLASGNASAMARRHGIAPSQLFSWRCLAPSRRRSPVAGGWQPRDPDPMTGHIDPTKEAFAAFRENDRAGPIHMLNLVRFRALAAYPDGRAATGAEAYAAYGRESAPVFARVGGRIVWRGAFELTLIGPTEERWDACFIAEYPSVAAFVEMLRDPAYREAVKHRQAAVADSRLVRLEPKAEGGAFG